MKRTNLVTAYLLAITATSAVAQNGTDRPKAAAQPDPVDDIVVAMRDAEQRAKSFRIEIETRGQLPGGLEVATKGVLHVLRGTQPALHSAVEVSFADGLAGRMESAQTRDGIVLFEDDPAFGELFVHVDATTVADLEWAGAVLERSDLPGMSDRRATAPLGSSMVADLQRKFALTATEKERAGEKGQWLAGPRRAGLDVQDPDLPLADRVELFVRDRDHALLEVRHLQRDTVLQHIVVTRVDVDIDLPEKAFRIDGRGQKLREVQQHLPMWEQIDQILRQAEAKAGERAKGGEEADRADSVRPSKRK